MNIIDSQDSLYLLNYDSHNESMSEIDMTNDNFQLLNDQLSNYELPIIIIPDIELDNTNREAQNFFDRIQTFISKFNDHNYYPEIYFLGDMMNNPVSKGDDTSCGKFIMWIASLIKLYETKGHYNGIHFIIGNDEDALRQDNINKTITRIDLGKSKYYLLDFGSKQYRHTIKFYDEALDKYDLTIADIQKTISVMYPERPTYYVQLNDNIILTHAPL